MRGRHGGRASQAKRRDEDYIACNDCGQVHARFSTYPVHPTDDRITPLRLLGLVIFGLFLFGVLLYAMPVVLIGLAGVVA